MNNDINHVYDFYTEIKNNSGIWTIFFDGDVLRFPDENGKLAFPVWSSENRALTFIKSSKGYGCFKPIFIKWELFKNSWIPDLIKMDSLILNCEDKISGWEIEVEELLNAMAT